MVFGPNVYELQYPLDYRKVCGRMMVKRDQKLLQFFLHGKIQKADELNSTFKIYRRSKGTCELNKKEVKGLLGKILLAKFSSPSSAKPEQAW